MTDLTASSHDPGGKVRLRLQSNVQGAALFSDCRRYRHVLGRTWGPAVPFALWIGMNPSTAAADCDDPTVRRECIFTRERLGLGAYVKVNVMDYRATDPKWLLEPGVIPCSAANADHIIRLAKDAKTVVAAWGALPTKLRHHAEAVQLKLEQEGIQLWALGLTKDGSPRHPLYVRGDAELVRWPQVAP